jgi:hypothetical protein
VPFWRKYCITQTRRRKARFPLHALPEEALPGFRLGRIVGYGRPSMHAIAGVVQRLARIEKLGLTHGLKPAISRIAEFDG